MEMFPHQITIYNLITDETAEEDEYQKTLLKNVLFVRRDNTQRNNTGLANSDSVTVYIPEVSLATADRKYLESDEFSRLNYQTKPSSFAFKKGDFIGLGDISLANLSLNEYKNKYENLFEITGISDFRFGSPLSSIVVSAK